jgi:GrpB-like predicted nucleotidyltransferase (UPF0157 family)
MLGLERHTVRLADYDPSWRDAFESESAELRRSVETLICDIQHVGSTAIAGIVAKPILDIAIAVRSRDAIAPLVQRLVSNGYIDRGDSGSDGGYLVVKNREPTVRLAHIHIVTIDDPQWKAYLMFRDALREDAGLRGDYMALKQQLAKEHPTNREAYTNGKRLFIEHVLSGMRRQG